VLGALALVFRALEFRYLPFRWDSNVYGSVFWGALVLHTLHLGSGVLESLLVDVLLFKGPVEKKHLVDIEVNGIYWYFAVFAWVPQFCILYLELVVFG
jgi:cytochrome c oxidase subunit I+III